MSKLRILTSKNPNSIMVNGKTFESKNGTFNINVDDLKFGSRGFDDFNMELNDIMNENLKLAFYQTLLDCKTVGIVNISFIVDCDKETATNILRIGQKHGIFAKYWSQYQITKRAKQSLIDYIKLHESLKEKANADEGESDIKRSLKRLSTDLTDNGDIDNNGNNKLSSTRTVKSKKGAKA